MTNTRYEVFNLVRDSNGLDHKEKHFINTVESRGQMYGLWENNAKVMGFKKDMYYATRESVLEKGLIRAIVRPKTTTLYEVDLDVLRKWAADHPFTDLDDEPDSDIQNAVSGSPESQFPAEQNPHSGMTEQKVTLEGNPLEGNSDKGSDAATAAPQAEPVVDESFKEDQEEEEATSNEVEEVAALLPNESDSLTIKEDVSDQTSPNRGPKVPTESSAHSGMTETGWGPKPHDQIRAYAKSHSGKARITLLLQRFDHGVFPELSGDAWTRHVLTTLGVSESLQDAQW